jgi:hypothetical protein
VHLLRRLRDATGADLVDAGEVLALHPDVRVDAREALAPGGAPPRGGQLLDSIALDDLPDFSEWLLAKREELAAAQTRRYRGAVEALAAAGQAAEAVGAAERWTEFDPLSEEAHRALMRALYDLGDRAAAWGPTAAARTPCGASSAWSRRRRRSASRATSSSVRCHGRPQREDSRLGPAAADAGRTRRRVGQDGGGVGQGARHHDRG